MPSLPLRRLNTFSITTRSDFIIFVFVAMRQDRVLCVLKPPNMGCEV